MPHALIVEDDESSLNALAELVTNEGFTASTAPSLTDARNDMLANPPDVLLVDLMLPDGSGIDILKELSGGNGPQVVLITGHASVDTAVAALRMGACDYLTKPLDVGRLKSVLANIARTGELKKEISSLRQELRKLGRFGPMIGSSPAMEQVYDLISKVAGTDATVLITGESGTGKELVARTVHELSRRRGPFLPLNCGAVAPNLIESELFGHERGSFTGADRTHKGYFERASGGTLFLDEITETPLELQVKLLRVLETGTLARIGGEQPLEVDVRVVAATNQMPADAVREGKLREDLLYRLQVFPMHLPALRDRGEDVVLLAQYFLAALEKSEGIAKSLSAAALARIRSYHWPGNVRELKNALHRAFILADTEIGPECLPSASSDTERPSGAALQVRVGASLAETERRLILATVEECQGDKKRAAQILRISLKTLYNRLNEYKVE
jgi:two-component system response regulator AtoC